MTLEEDIAATLAGFSKGAGEAIARGVQARARHGRDAFDGALATAVLALGRAIIDAQRVARPCPMCGAPAATTDPLQVLFTCPAHGVFSVGDDGTLTLVRRRS